MTIALDLGASAFRSLRMEEERLAGRSARAIYSVVEDTPVRRQMLDQLQTAYALCDGSLAIPGDPARDFAELMHSPLLPLLPEGDLPARDPASRQMIAALVEGLMEPPTEPGELCGLTLPGMSGSVSGRDSETAEFLMQIIRLQGYEPLPITPGTALVLADLVGDGFTGIGMTFGAAACHVSLVYRSLEIASCVVSRGGNWIDEQLAETTEQYLWDAKGNRYLDAETMCRWKESSAADLSTKGTTDRDAGLVRLYSELVDDVVQKASKVFSTSLDIPSAWPAMSVVACGGVTRIRGFVPMLAGAVREAELPVKVKQVRLSEDSDFTIARGCLIKAELDAEEAQGRAA